MLSIKKSHIHCLLLICLIAIGTLVIIGSASANDISDAINMGNANALDIDAIDMGNANMDNDNGIDMDNANAMDNIDGIDIGNDENADSIVVNDSDNLDFSISPSSDSLEYDDCGILVSGSSDSLEYSILTSNLSDKSIKSNLKESNENIYYVSNDGNDSNSGLSKEDPYLTLNKALEGVYNNNFESPDSSNIIYLSEGSFFEESLFYSIRNLTIIGEGINKTFLDGENTHRIAEIYNSSINFKNISFINGFNSLYGGAIYNEGNLTLINCSFSENKVFSGDYITHGPYAYGAAVYSLANLNVDDCVFKKNSLGDIYTNTAFGCAIYNLGNLSVNNSIFKENKVTTFMAWQSNYRIFQKGGAIYSICDNLSVSNSKFEGNALKGLILYPYLSHANFDSYTHGGAIYFEGNYSKFTNCSFFNNSADDGGAVWYNGNYTDFDSCNFVNNSAYRGTSIMIIDYNESPNVRDINNIYSHLTIANSVFENNHLINSSTTTNAFSDNMGGGVGYFKVDNVHILNSSFINNGLCEFYDSTYHRRSFAHSGALFLCGYNSTVENSTFINNKAEMGGAIYNHGFNTKIIDSSFVNNSALLGDGGAIFHSIGNLLVDNCTFNNNTAFRNGGTIQASYDLTTEELFEQKTVYNNSVFMNSNASYGGAIFDTGNSIVFENLTFINNSANYGGAIYKQGYSNSFRNLTFINNSASFEDYSNGGAIYNYGSNMLVESSSFINNSADLEGGAIFNFGESSLILNNTFDKNKAFKGGSIYLSGSGGRLQENNISSSFAINGGGLYNANADLICLNNTFNNCSANMSGGAIYNLVSTLELYANSMENCKANLSGLGMGNYVYTCGNISYLSVSFSNNASFNIIDNKSVVLVANITDNMGNPITGGNFSFILFNQSNNSSKNDSSSNGSSSNECGSGSDEGDSSSSEAGSGSDEGDSNSPNANAITGDSESTIIGVSEVIEGIATMTYSLNLELGTSYVISGTYSYAAEPIFTQIGSLNSVLSTKMYFASNIFDNKIVFGNNLTYELILLDSQNEYIPNAEIFVYLDGVYSKSVFTDDVGYLKDSISDIAIKGNHLYSFIYEGDVFHNRFTYDLNFEVFYNNTHFYDDVSISLSDLVYALVNTQPGNEINFQFVLAHEDGKALNEVSTPRYFLVYENNESLKGSYYTDYLGNGTGVDCLYYIRVDMLGHISKIHRTDDAGFFSMYVNKTEPGLYEYAICFIGGLVKQYDPFMHNHISEADNYYDPSNVSFILVVDHPDANISTNLNYTAPDIVTEIDFPAYSFNLTDANDNPLRGREIRIYDNGSYAGSAFTDFFGTAEFRFPNMLDIGNHLIEFVSVGDENYRSVCKVLELEVVDNPRKDGVAFFNRTSLNPTGLNNNLTVQLKDFYNRNLSNRTVNVVLSFNPSDFETFTFGGFDVNTYSLGEDGYAYTKNFTLVTDEYGLFTVPLELGAGDYRINCSYEGNKWYWGNERIFDLKLNKVGTLLFGQSSINVLKNESYLNVILSTDDLNLLSNSKIRYLVLKEDNNVSFNSSIANASISQLVSYVSGLPNYYGSFYAFTNQSSISRLKISLPVGKYRLISVFEGDKWYNGSSLLTDLTIFGELTKLETSQSTIIKKPGYYSVKLLDGNNNPLAGQIITITVDGKNYTRYTDNNGDARLEIDLDYGNYTVLSQFKGNINYSSSYVISDLFVVTEDYKYPSSLKVNSSNIYREKGQYQVVLYGINNERLANREIIINVNGTDYNALTDNEGIADLDYNFTIGTYMIVSYFKGDNNYQNSNISFILTVVTEDAANTILNSSIYWVLKGKGHLYTVTLQDKIQNPIVGETIVFAINDREAYSSTTDKYGNANFIVDLEPGSYNVNSYFRGSDVFYASNCYSKLVVLPVDNETNGSNVINSSNSSAGIDSSNSSSSSEINSTNGSSSGGSGLNPTNSSGLNPSEAGGSTSNITNGSGSSNINPSEGSGINSTNSSSANASNSTGVNNGSSANGGNTSNSTGVNNGSSANGGNTSNSTIDDGSSIDSGNSTGNGSSNSTSNETAKSDTIPRTATKLIYNNMTTNAVAKVDGRVGKYFEVILVDAKGKALANKQVAIGFNGKAYYRKTNAAGSAKLQINLGYEGKYTFAIAFLGDDDYKGSFEVALITVNKHSPKLNVSGKRSGKDIILSATLKSANGNAIEGKKISFTIDGKTYIAKTNSKGLASVKVSLNKKGTYSLQVKFAGDNSYKSITRNITLNILAPKGS